MAQVNDIRKMFFEKGMSYAAIARATDHDVKTVKKYIYMDDFNHPIPVAPKKRDSKLDKYKKVIDRWLEADKQERRKQRHTARRVYDRLREQYKNEFDCSYRLVATYVAEMKKALYNDQDQFYMPLVHISGEAQIDFGEADFFEDNVRWTGHYLNVSFPQSNGGYLQLFKGENMQCLAEGLMNVFAHIGGVPTRMWFDNLSPVVKKVLKNNGRELTDAFMRFQNHFAFEAAFCNVGKAHEKGHVENKVGYHRRNILVPPPHIDDLRDFNRRLLYLCDEDMRRPHYRKGHMIEVLFESDRKALLPLPTEAFDGSELKTVRTNSYAKFTLNEGKHTYSTAPRYANSKLLVRLTAYDVIILDENYREILKHSRLYGEQRQESMDWLPYLTQLSRRPAALKYTGIYPMLPKPVQDFLGTCDYETKKETLKVLAMLSAHSGFEKAAEAVQAALEYSVYDAESVKAIFNRLNSDILVLDPPALAADVPQIPSTKVDMGSYDRLFLRVGGSHEN